MWTLPVDVAMREETPWKVLGGFAGDRAALWAGVKRESSTEDAKLVGGCTGEEIRR
jgi:hypothetical protein